jgi:hypothetical protein
MFSRPRIGVVNESAADALACVRRMHRDLLHMGSVVNRRHQHVRDGTIAGSPAPAAGGRPPPAWPRSQNSPPAARSISWSVGRSSSRARRITRPVYTGGTWACCPRADRSRSSRRKGPPRSTPTSPLCGVHIRLRPASTCARDTSRGWRPGPAPARRSVRIGAAYDAWPRTPPRAICSRLPLPRRHTSALVPVALCSP